MPIILNTSQASAIGILLYFYSLYMRLDPVFLFSVLLFHSHQFCFKIKQFFLNPTPFSLLKLQARELNFRICVALISEKNNSWHSPFFSTISESIHSSWALWDTSYNALVSASILCPPSPPAGRCHEPCIAFYMTFYGILRRAAS
jgi:hypothetical protein